MADTDIIHALIVVSERPERAAVQEMLLSLHIEVEEAGSLEQALEALERCSLSSTPINLVFVASRFSGLNGRDCAREIRASYPTVAFILLRCAGDEEDAERHSDPLITGCLSFPLSRTAMVAALSRWHAVRSAPPVQAASERAAERLKALIPAYLNNRRKDLETLRAALQGEDFAIVARVGHNLKGTGTPYGFPEITEIGRWLEQSGKQGNPEEAARGLACLARYLESVLVEH